MSLPAWCAVVRASTESRRLPGDKQWNVGRGAIMSELQRSPGDCREINLAREADGKKAIIASTESRRLPGDKPQ